MCTYVVLIRFTEQGIANLAETIDRAEDFKRAAESHGATIDAQYWTTGPYDGVLIVTAPDDGTAAALVLRLGKDTNVTTCMLRTFATGEFKSITEKMR